MNEHEFLKNIPSDKELKKHLEQVMESCCNFKVPEELHNIDFFSFFDCDEAEKKEEK